MISLSSGLGPSVGGGLGGQSLLKSAVNNGAKPTLGNISQAYNNHRVTPTLPQSLANPPISSAFPPFVNPGRPQPNAPQPPGRLPSGAGNFDSSPLYNDQEFPSLANVRSSPASHQHPGFASPQLGANLMNANLFGSKDLASMRVPYGMA